MSHAITVGDVLAVMATVLGLLGMAGGLITYFAGAAEPTGQSKLGGIGCGIFIVGTALIVFGLRTLL